MVCPVCDNSDLRPFQGQNGFNIQAAFGVPILECSDCNFIFADFIHPQVIDYYYTHMCRSGSTPEEFNRLRQNARVGGRSQLMTMEPYLPSRIGRVLDFGGGSGEAARLFLPIGDEVFITEKDPHCIDHIMEEPRLQIIDGDDLMHEKYIGFFDLVIFSNVLEHMTYPAQRIQEFSRILSEGGQLFVEIPNEASYLRLSGKHCLQHISFFSLETFRKLIKKQGSFEIDDLRTCGPKIVDMVEAGELLHDFEAQDTPNGWVIRAMLRNIRPNTEIIQSGLRMDEVDATLSNLSQTIFLMNQVSTCQV